MAKMHGWRTETFPTDVAILRMDANVFWTYMQTVQYFVEHFEQIFLGVQMDDEQIMNSLSVQMDNR